MGKFSILILNSDLPVFPGRAGHEYLHTTHLARFGNKVGLVSLMHTREQDEKKQVLSDAGVNLYLWQHPNLDEFPSAESNNRPSFVRRMAKTIYIFGQTSLKRPQDTFVHDYTFRNFSVPILEALKRDNWQAMIVVQSRCARWLDFLPNFPASVLVMHDVGSLVYGRKSKTAQSWSQRLVCLLGSWVYRGFERTYCSKYDLIITVSSADETWVRKYYRPARLVTIPIPVDSNYFKPLPDGREEKARIMFTGMMNHPPNVDAAHFFAHQIFAKVQKSIPDAEFWIVGRDPLPEVEALADLAGVVVTGFVDDIRPYIAQATLIIVPLRFGAGMRNKILEAWAMEKCVISTSIGAEGLDYKHGTNILIADEVQSIAACVIQAIKDPQLRNRIRVAGRDLIIKQHHPERLAREYHKVITSTIRAKKQRRGPLRALVDLRWMRPGLAGGTENLSRSFLKHLMALDAYNRYTLMLPSEIRYDFDLRNHANFHIILADSPRVYFRKVLWYGARIIHRLFKVDYWRSAEVETLRQARALDAEVALSIPGYIHPDLYPLANVLLVPDIQHEYYPEYFSQDELNARRRLYTDSVRRARYLCAISEFTRQTLIDRLGVEPERVSTTHLAADPLFYPQSPYRGNHKEILRKYGLPKGEYLFFPANTWPHKNHQSAFKALKIMGEAHRLKPLLVCTGTAKNAQPDLLALIRDLHLGEQVKFLGYCPSTEMPALYEGAAALIFPSLFEGFGMPVLEAMWCDCPVVCSNVTSLPEIAGDAALLVAPDSPEELAHETSRILNDDELRCTLIERGRRQAANFSWLKFTMETVRVLHRVHEERYG
jgi:glycosyltransferase involved in cell wall biosynthesis